MNSHAPSPPEDYDVAVVGLSARALARSARRAGLRALAIDLFADADTREHAAKAVKARPSKRGIGFDRKDLLATLRRHAPEGLPVALGAGFEHAPRLMAAIGRRNPLRGATPETVARLKDPFAFSDMLAALGVPHPAVARSCEIDGALDGWLSKRAGASGGAHIRRSRSGAFSPGRYLQRRIDGRPLSALFLANGRDARILGFSEQWADPTPRAPFRYGGAAGSIALPAGLADRIAAALQRIVEATALGGLASADLIVSRGDDAFHLLEINPRPGATLDVFDRGESPSLLALHLASCDGRLPSAFERPASAQAAAVVYARRAVSVTTLQRPVWTADWPACEEIIPAGAPVCTILAAGATSFAARALLAERRAALLESLRAVSTSRPSPNPMVPA
ncbi:MAG TPA: ATP-grasp domain-containing protein [Hansschlegelia sp.]